MVTRNILTLCFIYTLRYIYIYICTIGWIFKKFIHRYTLNSQKSNGLNPRNEMGMKKNNQSIYLNNIHLEISKNFVFFTKKTYSLYKLLWIFFFEYTMNFWNTKSWNILYLYIVYSRQNYLFQFEYDIR